MVAETHIDPKSFEIRLNAVSKRCEIKKVNPHALRHTYITRLFEAGLDIKEIQYLAGHSTIDMTLRVYTHYDRLSRNAQTAEKVREALRAM